MKFTVLTLLVASLAVMNLQLTGTLSAQETVTEEKADVPEALAFTMKNIDGEEILSLIHI